MADLTINDLDGSELFNDSESFLADLDEEEDIIGGRWCGYGKHGRHGGYGNVFGNIIITSNVTIGNQTGIIVSNNNSGIFNRF